MERVGTAGGITIYDDYAHHPTELRATIKAFRMIPARRRIGIFQPHRYTRTKLLAEEFAKSFEGLDEIVITGIYAASEKPIKGVSARLIADKIRNVGKVTFIEDKNEIVQRIAGQLQEKDLVITFGAGDIYRIGTDLLYQLRKTR
jgi:UDP-N-acetylmuramate--alanine ligase